MCFLPVAAEDIEQNDDKAQTVTGQVGTTKEPGESPGVMLPSRHLKHITKMTRSLRHDCGIQTNSSKIYTRAEMSEFGASEC